MDRVALIGFEGWLCCSIIEDENQTLLISSTHSRLPAAPDVAKLNRSGRLASLNIFACLLPADRRLAICATAVPRPANSRTGVCPLFVENQFPSGRRSTGPGSAC